MSSLHSQRCEACRAGAPTVSDSELKTLAKEIPHWQILRKENIQQLQRVFTFPDFQSAMVFTNKIAKMAAAENHHPAVLVEWGKVTVNWWSHKIKGLHKNDFIMAAKTDRIL